MNSLHDLSFFVLKLYFRVTTICNYNTLNHRLQYAHMLHVKNAFKTGNKCNVGRLAKYLLHG